MTASAATADGLPQPGTLSFLVDDLALLDEAGLAAVEAQLAEVSQ